VGEPTDKARDEFFSEAQEIVETLSRSLLELDASMSAGRPDPSQINEAFRAAHTLKGLAGLFGATTLSRLAHRFEDLLDELRLGRRDVDASVLDLLFSAVEVFQQVLASERERREPPAAVDELLGRLGTLSKGAAETNQQPADYDLDPGILAVLTEYEEHRLTSNLHAGLGLFRVRVEFELATIDTALEDVKARAKPYGEIITYLPSGEASSPDTIQLDLLLASNQELATLVGAIGNERVLVEEIPRKKPLPAPLRPAAPEAVVPSAGEPAPLAEARDEDGGAIAGATSLRAITQTVRVDIRRLDQLMNVVGELAIVRGALDRFADRLRGEGQRQLAAELQRIDRSFERRLSELQDGILEVRMVPLAQVFERLARVVRQLSRDVNKEIRLVITGAETEIDKLIVEELSDPLMHMIRNAIDHGIESADARAAVGKPPAGTIALNAYHKGNHVMIEVEDDGRGIDTAAITRRAVELGQLDDLEASELTEQGRLALMFLPGVSSRGQADDLSGRGVGMDVVKTNVSKLGGVIDVHSEMGIGTKMTITLPTTLAIVSSLLVRVGADVFALPMTSVSAAFTLSSEQVRFVDGRRVMTLRGSTLPLCQLEDLLRLELDALSIRRFVVVISLGTRRLGLVVDHLVGQQDIVIKPLGKSLKGLRGFAGATELGDQRVALVLDPGAIIDEVLSGTESIVTGRSVHA